MIPFCALAILRLPVQSGAGEMHRQARARSKLVNWEAVLMFDVQIVGRKIGKLRKKCNLTQMELADRMGVSYQAVSNWERGGSLR